MENEGWQGHGETETLVHAAGTVENNMGAPQKVTCRRPGASALPFPAMCPVDAVLPALPYQTIPSCVFQPSHARTPRPLRSPLPRPLQDWSIGTALISSREDPRPARGPLLKTQQHTVTVLWFKINISARPLGASKGLRSALTFALPQAGGAPVFCSRHAPNTWNSCSTFPSHRKYPFVCVYHLPTCPLPIS